MMDFEGIIVSIIILFSTLSIVFIVLYGMGVLP